MDIASISRWNTVDTEYVYSWGLLSRIRFREWISLRQLGNKSVLGYSGAQLPCRVLGDCDGDDLERGTWNGNGWTGSGVSQLMHLELKRFCNV